MKKKYSNPFYLGIDIKIIESLNSSLNVRNYYTAALKDNFELVQSFAESQNTHFDHRKCKACIYDFSQFEDLVPVDQELLTKLLKCEQIFLGMADRLFIGPGYRIRHRQYLDHVRFWYNFFLQNDVDLILAAGVPHEGYDFVIYSIAVEVFNIKFIGAYTLPIRPGLPCLGYLWTDLENHSRCIYESSVHQNSESGLSLLRKYVDEYKNQQEFKPFTRKNNLFESWTNSILLKFRALKRRIVYAYENDLLADRIAKRLLLKRIGKIQFETSIYFESEVIVNRFYKKNSIKLTEVPYNKYIYFPLHYQPEASTSPLGGVYSSQELVCAAISSFMPDDCALLVKEHPRASKAPNIRNVNFYKRILSCKNTFLLDRSTDPNLPLKESYANASVTGTTLFESIIFRKHALMFGTRIFEDAPRIYRIKENKDLESAFRKIAESKELYLENKLYENYFAQMGKKVFKYVVSKDDMNISKCITLEESNRQYLGALKSLLALAH